MDAGYRQFPMASRRTFGPAAKHPTRWRDIGELPEWRRAAELLEMRGVIETRQPTNQNRGEAVLRIARRFVKRGAFRGLNRYSVTLQQRVTWDGFV
jgi:hypothetical protein